MKTLLRRNLASSLVTITILGVILGGYYLRVRGQTVYFDHANVRRLATMATQIESTFDGYGWTLQSLYSNPPEVPLNLQRYLWNQTYLEERALDHDGHKPGLHLKQERGWLYFDYDPPKKLDQFKPDFPIRQDPELTQKPEQNFDRKSPIYARASIREALDYFVPHDPVIEPFDMIALADEHGQVIYHSTARGVKVSDLSKIFDSRDESERRGHVDWNLANGQVGSIDSNVHQLDSAAAQAARANGASGESSGAGKTMDYDRLLAGTTAQEIEIAGVHYKTYSQPVVLRLPEAEPLHWVLSGFVRPERFTAQTWSLPYPILIGLLFLVTMLFLAMPLLKLALLPRHGRFHRSDFALCTAAALLLPGLVAVLLAYVNQHVHFSDLTDTHLKRLAEDVDAHLSDEIRAAILELDQLTARLASADRKLFANESNVLWDDNGRISDNGRINLVSDPYKNFSLVFWADKSGTQHVKWSSGEDVSSFSKLGDNPAFRRFQDERRQLIIVNGTEREFSLDTDRSPATGENRAVIGIPIELKGTTGTKISAAFLVGRLESVFAPVLPPGFGFCIVERDGTVRFHSEPLLNRAENLFVETDDDKSLQSAVLGDTPAYVDATYKGRPRSMYVKRFQEIKAFPALTLVVFKDDIYDQTMTADIVTIAMSLYGSYVLIGMCILLSIFLVARPRVRDLVWPTKRNRRKYGCLIVPLCANSIALAGLLVLRDIQLLIYSSGALVALSVLLTWAVLVYEKPRRLFGLRWLQSGLALREAFTLVCLLLILNVSVFPALVAFRAAHVYESVLFLHYGQQKMLEQMEQRYDFLHYRQQWSHVAASVWGERYAIDDQARYSYHASYFRSKVKKTDAAGHKYSNEWFGPGLDVLLEWMNPRYNRIAMEARGMKASSPDGDWDWPKATMATVTLHKHHYQNSKDVTVEIQSDVPLSIDPQVWWPWGLIGLAIVVGVCMAVLYAALLWMLSRLFLLEFAMPVAGADSAAPARVCRHTMLLAHAWDDTDYLAGFEGMQVLDFCAPIGFEEGGPTPPGAANLSLIGIRNLDLETRDAERNTRKLRELERLLAMPGVTVVLLSRVDPLFHLPANGMAPEDLERWREAIGKFERVEVAKSGSGALFRKRVRGRIAPTIGQERAEEIMSVFESESGLGPALEPVAATIAKGSGQISCVEQLVDEFADYGERYYANAWAACSDWERITLRDLASGAFLIAPVRAELRELARKRLLVPTRGCALASEGFRRYILGAIDPRAAVRLRTPESGAWTAIPRIAGAFLGGITLIVIVALIFGQRETLQSFVAYLTAALGGVGTLARFLAGSKRASESEDTHA